MRANQIKEGAELFYSREMRWHQGRGTAIRAVVVDPTVQSWDRDPNGVWTRAKHQSRRFNPPSVLVDLYIPQFDYSSNEPLPDEVRRQTARTVELRGHWAECLEIHRAEQEASRAAHAEASRVYREKALAAETASATCEQLGVEAKQFRGTAMLVEARELTEMAEALAGIGWVYQPPVG